MQIWRRFLETNCPLGSMVVRPANDDTLRSVRRDSCERTTTMPAGPTPLSLGRERRIQSSRDALVRRVYGEFYEMPCLRLTPGQAQRLFDLRPDVCQRILTSL